MKHAGWALRRQRWRRRRRLGWRLRWWRAVARLRTFMCCLVIRLTVLWRSQRAVPLQEAARVDDVTASHLLERLKGLKSCETREKH